MQTISIFGSTGFIGTELIGHLAKKKNEIRVFTRNKIKANHLKLIPNVKLVTYSENSNLKDLLKGTDILINLIGILHESKKNTFIDVHEGLTKEILKSAKNVNVKRLIHVSALKCETPGESKYLFSKLKGEKVVISLFKNKDWTILRPSIVYGPNDKFINLFIKMIKCIPILFLISPKAKFQPIHVDDFVDITIKVIDSKKSFQRILNIAGPKVLTFLEIVNAIKKSLNKKNLIVPLNKTFTYFFVRCLELLPIKLVTRDNLKSMEIDNITDVNDAYQYKSSLKNLSSYLERNSE